MKKKFLFLVAFLLTSCLFNTQAMAACPKDRPLLVGAPWINKNCRDFKIQLLSELRFLEDPYSINFPIVLPGAGWGCELTDNENLCKKLKVIKDLQDDIDSRDEVLQRAHGGLLTPEALMDLYAIIYANAMLDLRIIDELISECGDKEAPLCQKLEKLKDKFLKMWPDKKDISESYAYDTTRYIIDKINEVLKQKNDVFKIKKEIIDEYNDRCKIEHKPDWFTLTTVDGPIWDARGSNLFQEHIGYIEQVMEYREKIDEHNLKLQTRNLDTLATNMTLEKENDATVAAFEKFYTPDKAKQLLKEYEKAVSKLCVGCEYPEPLEVNKSDCQQCSEREFIDGKCVLKKITNVKEK